MTRLWEADHPYHHAEGNHLVAPAFWEAKDVFAEYGSWKEFAADDNGVHDADPDLDLVYRWDWLRDEEEGDTLHLHVVKQRKAHLHSVRIGVTDRDEPAIRAWLASRAPTLAAMWAPLPLANDNPPGGAT